MSEDIQEVSGQSVVLVGSFDPTLVQPQFLLEKGLVRESDLSSLKIETMIPDVAALSFSWLSIVVERTKITASTTLTYPAPEPVRDFILDLVKEMRSSRLTALGINSDHHFQARDVQVWHRVGDRLAPKEGLWDQVLTNPGMQAIWVRGERDDRFDGYILVRVEPSTRISNGIYVQVNDHFEITANEADAAPHALLARLTDQWSASSQRSDRIINRDSPDESQTGINVRVFPALLQDRREVLTATSTSGNPNAWSRV